MAKAKKGPRQTVGLQCSECKAFNYVTEYNKNNEQLKVQAKGGDNQKTFPLKKYCQRCQKHTEHKMAKKLK
jgi:ribosomal protein L33